MLYPKRIIFPVLFIALLISEGCNKGIEPEYDNPGFSGRVTFQGTWPDSIKRTYIIVFDSLLEEPNDFNLYNIKFLSGELPFGVAYYDFDSRDSALIPINTGVYAYVAVVQQATDQISFDPKKWIVAGVYHANNDTTQPGQLVISHNAFVKNINIICDFNNPPPQPTGG
jgi:hypothetical protein